MRKIRPTSLTLVRVFLWLLTLTVFLPFAWLVKSVGPHYWENMKNLVHLDNGVVFTWLKNSAIVTFSGLLFSVLSSVMAGFVLAILEIRFRRTILVLTLITMLIPVTAMAMPLYVLINQIHLHDTLIGLILASSYYPFGAFLSYLYFSSALPKDVVDIGRMDGLGDWGVFWHIGVPLSKSLWSIVTFFSFISLWNSYQLPKFLLDSPQHSTLPMGLQLIFGDGSALVGVLMLVPVVGLYLLSQRSIESGIFSGAVKG